MGLSILPAINGTTTIRAEPQSFVAAFSRRVQSGLLGGAAGRRSQYIVVNSTSDSFRFRAASWPTAISVGLNDVRLSVSAGRVVNYQVEFKTWATYAVALSAAIGILFIGFLLIFDLRAYIASHSGSGFLGFSVEQNIAIAWSMALFWGFIWPWLLIAIHKRPLRRLIERLIAEVDASA